MSNRLPVGTRVRLNDLCVWPERRGCYATVVAPPEPGVYPDDPRSSDVLLLLDDDPLGTTRDGWTCLVERPSCTEVAS